MSYVPIDERELDRAWSKEYKAKRLAAQQKAAAASRPAVTPFTLARTGAPPDPKRLQKKASSAQTFEQQEKMRARKRGCVDIDQFVAMAPAQREQLVRPRLPEAPADEPKTEQKVVSESASLPPTGLGCCNSVHCTAADHGHADDSTAYGIAEQTRRQYLVDHPLPRVAAERQLSNMDVPKSSAPPDEGAFCFTNPAFRAGIQGPEAPLFFLVALFRAFCAELRNCAATIEMQRAAVNDIYGERRSGVIRTPGSLNTEALGALDEDHKFAQLSVLQTQFDARLLLRLRGQKEIQEHLQRAGRGHDFMLASVLQQMIEQPGIDKNEQQLLDAFRDLFENGAQASHPLVVACTQVATPNERPARRTACDDPGADADAVKEYRPCDSQFVADPACAACTTIAITACIRFLRTCRVRLPTGDYDYRVRVDEPFWQATLDYGIGWWRSRPDQECRFLHAHEALTANQERKEYVSANFKTAEYGGRMYSATSESCPTPDFRTALNLCRLEAAGGDFACTVSYRGGTIAVAFMNNAWYVFDSHGDGSDEFSRSILLRCRLFDDCIEQIYRLFCVKKTAAREPEDRDDVAGASAEKAYDMMLFYDL